MLEPGSKHQQVRYIVHRYTQSRQENIIIVQTEEKPKYNNPCISQRFKPDGINGCMFRIICDYKMPNNIKYRGPRSSSLSVAQK